MQESDNAVGDTPCAGSSFPLVDFISRWRLRDRPRHHRSANGLEAGDLAGSGSGPRAAHEDTTPSLPLLSHRFSSHISSTPSSPPEEFPSSALIEYDEVPYPLPEAFLPLPTSASGTASKNSWTHEDDEDDDDDDDRQSIQSYDSDHIRQYDRLSKVSSVWPPDEEDEKPPNCSSPAKNESDSASASISEAGCVPLLSTLCFRTAASMVTSSDQEDAIEMQQRSSNKKRDSKKNNTSR